jgi:hypothetical protein
MQASYSVLSRFATGLGDIWVTLVHQAFYSDLC